MGSLPGAPTLDLDVVGDSDEVDLEEAGEASAVVVVEVDLEEAGEASAVVVAVEVDRTCGQNCWHIQN